MNETDTTPPAATATDAHIKVDADLAPAPELPLGWIRFEGQIMRTRKVARILRDRAYLARVCQRRKEGLNR